jgi:hypothetical protein
MPTVRMALRRSRRVGPDPTFQRFAVIRTVGIRAVGRRSESVPRAAGAEAAGLRAESLRAAGLGAESLRAGVKRRARLWHVAVLACANCTPTAPLDAPPAEAHSPPPLQLGVLTDFVPAAGLRWLVAGSPRHFAEQPALAGLRERWLTAQRLQAFAQATGIELARTERALVAGFDLGTLYLADSSGWIQKPELPFIERLAGSARVQRTHPDVWRVTGLVGSTPEALVRLDDAVVAVAVQDPMLARIVEYRARGRLHDVVPALQGAALSALPGELLESGPLRAYALGPWSESAVPEGAGLLAAASALGAAVEIDGGTLRLRLAIAGYWDVEQDREHLLSMWEAVATSPLGRASGLDQPLSPFSARVSERALEVAVELDAKRVLAALEQVAAGRLEPLLAPAGRPERPESSP